MNPRQHETYDSVRNHLLYYLSDTTFTPNQVRNIGRYYGITYLNSLPKILCQQGFLDKVPNGNLKVSPWVTKLL